MSTIAILGGAALGEVSQDDADAAISLAITYGVNHIDIAPSYGQAEARLSPWIPSERQRFFLGCKTLERSRESAWAELNRSLERMKTDHFDLYQAHAVNDLEKLDLVTRPGGSLEAMIQAREQGLTNWIGITGHGVQSPKVMMEALRRYDFDSILFPINFIQYANSDFRREAEELLSICRARDVGVMVIKSITRQPWGDLPERYHTWYLPFENQEEIQSAINFALSQNITGLCSVGDTRLLPLFLQACQNFTRMNAQEQQKLIASAGQYSPLFS
jgi:aryl-alcohol dehydrogenase-like predicted oxidoreductase